MFLYTIAGIMYDAIMQILIRICIKHAHQQMPKQRRKELVTWYFIMEGIDRSTTRS